MTAIARCARMLLFSVMAVVCCACVTGITVTRLQGAPPSVTGNPWNLPMTQFQITITRHVIACGPTINVSVEPMVTTALAVDPDQRYLLRSNGTFATSDIISTLSPAGVSTGLNAQSTDSTATVISNVIGTAAQVALFAAAAGQPGTATVAQQPSEVCKPEIVQAVHELYPDPALKTKPLKAIVDEDTSQLAIATAKVAVWTAKYNVDKSPKAELLAAIDAQARSQTQLSQDQKQLTKDMSLTTATQVVTWPLLSSDFRRDTPFTLDRTTFNKWSNGAMDSTEAPKKADVYLALYRLDPSDGSWKAPPPPVMADVKVGVPVRLAATGRLALCMAAACGPALVPGTPPDPAHPVIVNDFQVLQLGPMYVVPVTGGIFRSESAAISLDKNGLPTSIESSEKAAAAAGASGAAKDAATQLAGLPASIRAAQLARTQAETNQLTANAALATAEASAGTTGQANTLTAQTALITAQNNLAEAKQNAGVTVQTSETTAQSTLLNAQATLVTAQANAQVVDQTSVLAAQTTLLNAQTQQINAAAALAKAKASGP
jgi:hypothetical protein